MKRRVLLTSATAALAVPAVSRAQSKTTLRFIPQADPSILDPHFNTAYVTRNHAYMVYDTLSPAMSSTTTSTGPSRSATA